jgi:flagellar biosynthesis GTPase FlhF
MLSSQPNVRCCLFPGNKVTLKNESKFVIHYEITVLKGAKINHCKFGVSGPSGNGFNGEADIQDAERLPPEYGELYPLKPKYVTISGGSIFTVKYKYEGLHTDWSPETRNFSVYDDLVFEQPLIKDVEKIRRDEDEERRRREDEERRRREDEERRRREDEEKRIREDEERRRREDEERRRREDEERRRREDEERRRIEEATRRMCSSKYGHMCSAPDRPKQQCWKCHDWYCNYHARPNNNPFGKGGHICN